MGMESTSASSGASTDSSVAREGRLGATYGRGEDVDSVDEEGVVHRMA